MYQTLRKFCDKIKLRFKIAWGQKQQCWKDILSIPSQHCSECNTSFEKLRYFSSFDIISRLILYSIHLLYKIRGSSFMTLNKDLAIYKTKNKGTGNGMRRMQRIR